MRKVPKRSAREEALRRHWDEEWREFGLKPWERPPCLVTLDDADPDWRPDQIADWNRARAMRRQLLAADPHHYDDLLIRRKATR